MKQPEEILKNNPGSLVFARYAQQRAMEGNISEAILILEKGIKSNPSYALGHSVLANILHTQNSPEGAAEEWTTALKLDPQIPNDLFQFGKYLLNNDNRSEACKYLSIASKYEPDNTDILIALDQAMTGTDDENGLDLAEETTDALAEMYEMDVESEITAHMESDDTQDAGGTAIVEALDAAQDESFFDEDEEGGDEFEDTSLNETVTESVEPDETAVILTEEDHSSPDIGDTVISGVYTPIDIEEEVPEDDDFDSLLKSFVDYDEEDDAAAGTKVEDSSLTEAPDFEVHEDTVIPESGDEDAEPVEPVDKESDDTLISGVYEAIEEEEEKAASEDIKSLLETYSGDEKEDKTLVRIPEEGETETIDSSILDTIAPQTTANEEYESDDTISAQTVIDEVAESVEEPQSDSPGDDIAENHEYEAEETALIQDAETSDKPIPGEDADGELQPDELSDETVVIEPVEDEVIEDTVLADLDEVDDGSDGIDVGVDAEKELQEDTNGTVSIEPVDIDVSEDIILTDLDEIDTGGISEEVQEDTDETVKSYPIDDVSEDIILTDLDGADNGVVTEEKVKEDTDESVSGNIADEFPFNEFKNDVKNLMSYFEEDSETDGDKEPDDTVMETETETESSDVTLPDDLPEFSGSEIEVDIASLGIDDVVTDDETVLQIDEENEYDPAQFKTEPKAEVDDDPVLSSQERSELLGLDDELQDVAGEISEMTEVIQESADQEADEILVDIPKEQAVSEPAVDETDSPMENLYNQLNKADEISDEPESTVDVSEPVTEEEVREGIDYSDVLANIENEYEEKTMDVDNVFENSSVIKDDTESDSADSSTLEVTDSVFELELPDTGNNDIDISRETLEDLLDDYIYTLKEPVEESGADEETLENRDDLSEKTEEITPVSEDATVSDVTATMAEIYVSQGLRSRAIDIYRTLLYKDPDNERFRNRIDELNTMPDQLSDSL